MSNEITIKGGSMAKPKKVGTVQTVNAETGQVVGEKKNAMTLLGPPPDKCQVCAVDHPHDQPHSQQSMYYQMAFHSEHGRWPTWTDAMAHCSQQVKTLWRRHLIEVMKQHGLDIPDDLMEPMPKGR